MHFAFTDQQTRVPGRRPPGAGQGVHAPADLRAAYDRPGPAVAAVGHAGRAGRGRAVTVPEAQGGLGLGLVDLVPLLEEAGRVALPEPLLETTALAAPLLAELEGRGHGERLRARGPATTWAGHTWLEPSPPARWPRRWSRRPAAVARRRSAGGRRGRPLRARHGGGERPGEVHLRRAGAVVTVTPVPSLDPTRRLGIPALEAHQPGPGRWPGRRRRRPSGGPADRAAVATGAELLGLTERMITLAAEYAKERHQFGKPIGSFQAVKHLLAGAQVKLEFARPVVYGAAWALDEGERRRRRVRRRRPRPTPRTPPLEAARVSLQVHGAIGYTWECDLHLFLKRAWALAEAWGSAADHRARVLESLLADGLNGPEPARTPVDPSVRVGRRRRRASRCRRPTARAGTGRSPRRPANRSAPGRHRPRW